MTNITMRNITMRNITRRLPYIEISRGGYGRFRGMSFKAGMRSVFHAEVHIYKRESGFGGYTNFANLIRRTK